MLDTRSLKMVAGAAIVAAGCHAAPKTKPQILSSRPPAGSPQAPPLNSRQAIDVPSAPVMQSRPVAAVVTPVPAVQAGPPAGYLVPAQPQPQPQPQGQLQQQTQLPQQAQTQAQTRTPGYGELQPPDQRPANSKAAAPGQTQARPGIDNETLVPPDPRK